MGIIELFITNIQMKITSGKWYYAKLVVGVAAISFSPLAVKLVSFSPTVSAFYRSLYAALFSDYVFV